MKTHKQGSELTPAAEAAFSEIFSRHSINSGMDIRSMVSEIPSIFLVLDFFFACGCCLEEAGERKGVSS